MAINRDVEESWSPGVPSSNSVRMVFASCLPKLHTPLIVTEDIPNNALYKDLVLVHGDKCPKALGCQGIDKKCICGLVALKYFKRKEFLNCRL